MLSVFLKTFDQEFCNIQFLKSSDCNFYVISCNILLGIFICKIAVKQILKVKGSTFSTNCTELLTSQDNLAMNSRFVQSPHNFKD